MFDLYKKTIIGDASTYIRSYQTTTTGPLNGPNTITIYEEMIANFPDDSTQKIVLDTPVLQYTVTDPTVTFDIVNPTTGEVTGTMTLAQLKVQMYSLYLYLASLRDGS